MSMKAPVSKVDCSKGDEAESSWEAKEGEKEGTPPGVFVRVRRWLSLLGLRDSRNGNGQRVRKWF